MQKNNVLILTIDSETFGELKADFNQVLRTTLANMEAKESNQAKLTVTLQIQLARGIAPDFDKKKYNTKREFIRPIFAHKVSSTIQTKYEENGILEGNYELIRDKISGNYAMRPVDDGQVSLDEGGTKVGLL